MIYSIVNESFTLLAQMGPYLLLGILVAGALHVLLPVGLVSSQLGGAGLRATLKAAIVGIPLPICSCGVVPVAASLKKSGASNGAVVSFLVTTPTTGVDSILATYSLLGLPIAIARVVTSFVIGLIAGIATNLSGRGRGAGSIQQAVPEEITATTSTVNRLQQGLRYALDELMAGIARPMAIGILLGGVIATFMPPGFLQQYVGDGWTAYLVMLAVGTPLYVCASGSIPLAAVLLAKGISPGAALVFLIAGPATNIATITVIRDILGSKTLVVYLTTLLLGALAAGYGTDAALSALAIDAVSLSPHLAHGDHGLSVFNVVTGIILGLLIAFHIVRPIAARLGRKTGGDDVFKLKVPDMNCQHCAGSITKAVSGISGVNRVDADPGSKMVQVEMDEMVDTEIVTQAIIDAGFHPEGA